jgi:hypothetical protein
VRSALRRQPADFVHQNRFLDCFIWKRRSPLPAQDMIPDFESLGSRRRPSRIVALRLTTASVVGKPPAAASALPCAPDPNWLV